MVVTWWIVWVFFAQWYPLQEPAMCFYEVECPVWDQAPLSNTKNSKLDARRLISVFILFLYDHTYTVYILYSLQLEPCLTPCSFVLTWIKPVVIKMSSVWYNTVWVYRLACCTWCYCVLCTIYRIILLLLTPDGMVIPKGGYCFALWCGHGRGSGYLNHSRRHILPYMSDAFVLEIKNMFNT